MVQKSGIQCYNFKEYGHVVRECQKPKRAKDAAYHREKMLLCKQEEAGIQLNADQADWKDDTDDESDDQELEAHYMYMAKIQEVSPDAVDSGPIFDTEPEQKTRIVQETLHANFLENQPNVAGSGPKWLFDIDTLTQSMNYQPVVVGNQPNHNVGIQENLDVDPQNTDADAAFDVKDNETEVHHYASPSDNVVRSTFEISGKSSLVDPSPYPDDLDMPALEDIVYSDDEEDVGAEADFFNLETNISVSPILTTRVHKDHPISQIIGELTSAPQTRSMARMEEGIDYEEVFASVARIEAIKLFLAYASFMGFMVYQMDVKSAFLYGTIKEEVYVCQRLGFKDPDYPDKVYKVVKALYGLHQVPRAWDKDMLKSKDPHLVHDGRSQAFWDYISINSLCLQGIEWGLEKLEHYKGRWRFGHTADPFEEAEEFYL
nr:putative ribonuclease H-like domain-containing protein [Tanacetum cinerariifolium]